MEVINYLKPLIQWLHLHPGWTGFVTFMISLTESLAVVGYFVPGSVMMTAIGTLIGAGIIPTISTMIWAIAGAVVGDGISYRLGYFYKDRIKTLWPLYKYPHWVEKGENFFHQHGAKSVFLGRFVGAVRPMVPLIAGMLKMSPIRFFFSNLFSAILWAPAYMVPGILIGAASMQLDPETATELVLWVLLILILIGLSFWVLKKLIYAMINFAHLQLDRLWAFLLRHPSFRPLCLALQNPYHPEGHGQLTMALGFLLTLLAFIIVTISVTHHGFAIQLNAPLHHFFRSLHSEFTDKLMILITVLGDKRVLLPTSAIIMVVLSLQRQWRAALHWIAAIVICSGIAYFLKSVIDFTRPLDIVAAEASHSYPSGHVAVSTIFFGFLAILIGHNYGRQVRATIYTSSVVIIGLIIFSRLCLGAHWFSDIVGATLLGVTTLLLVTISYRREPYPQLKLSWVYGVGGILYLALYIGVIYKDFNHLLQSYQPLWPSAQILMRDWWQQDPAKPIVRTNRFGQPIHLINIQWADQLNNIRRQLIWNGWIQIPKQSIHSTIGRFAKDSQSKQLPLIPPSYQGQNPELIMVKPAGINSLLLVLRLWNSRVQFINTRIPLWLGTVNYRYPRGYKFWQYKEYRQRYRYLPPAIIHLQPITVGNQWRSITYSPKLKPTSILPTEWNGGTLLLRPANRIHGFKIHLEVRLNQSHHNTRFRESLSLYY